MKQKFSLELQLVRKTKHSREYEMLTLGYDCGNLYQGFKYQPILVYIDNSPIISHDIEANIANMINIDG